jgi:hypothetical protein
MAETQPDMDGATAAFERAVAAARGQHATLLELRALTTLITHQQAIGVPVSSLGRLAELVGHFPEDCELADLVQARALLDPWVAAR